MYPHRIRLRGPWECEPVARTGPGELPASRRMTLPCRWGDGGLHDFAGRVCFTRRFGYPGRIDDFERVWLIVAGVEDSASLELNGAPIGSISCKGGSFETDVTALLRERNQLTVTVDGGVDGGLWGEVALEVRCLAFLRDIRVEAVPGALQIGGKVFGSADRPLELYAVLGRRTTDYATVTPSLAGTTFRLSAELPAVANADEPLLLKVDLVNGAMVWYTFEHVCDAALAERPRN